MSTNRHQFEFIIQNVDSTSLSVIKFASENYRLCGNYHFNIELVIPNGFNHSNFLNQKATLKLWEWGTENPHLIHGIIIQTSIGQSIGLDGLHLSVILASPLAHLKDIQNSRVFQNKSVVDMITQILTENHWLPGSFEFQALNNVQKEKWIIQYQQSDLAFILHELARSGLVYTFKQTNEAAVLVFFDAKNPNTYQTTTQTMLECIEPKGMGSPKPTILSWTQKTQLLEEGIVIEIIAKTTAKNLIPGQRLTILDKSKAYINGDYLVITIQHQGDQRSGFSEWGGEETSIDYINTITLVPLHSAYQTTFKPKRSMTGIHSAYIESAAGDYPYLTEQGAYHVRFPFDKSTTLKGEASPPLQLIQPLAGIDHGCHFALHAKTEVAVTFREGDGCYPVLVGVLPNHETPSPIQSDEPSRHRLRTSGDNTLEFEDLKDKESVHLFTHDENNQLLLDATKDKHQVILASQQGSTEFNAGDSANIEIQQSCTHHVGKNSQTTTQGHRELIVKNGGILINTQKNMFLKANEDIHLQVTKNAEFLAEGVLEIQAKNKLSLIVSKNDFKITNVNHALQLKANQTIAVIGNNQGNMVLRQGDSYINVTKNGDLHLKADKITLKARKLYIPANSENSQ